MEAFEENVDPLHCGSDGGHQLQPHCFLCLIKLEPNSTLEKVHPSTFHCLLRYLKINPEEEVKRSESEPAMMMDMGNADVVQMCKQCSRLSQLFSSVYQQLERFEMEAIFYLRLIGDKMNMANGEDMERKEQKPLGRWGTLREKARDKCTYQLNNLIQPRVHVYKMTADEVNTKITSLSKIAPVHEETMTTSPTGDPGDPQIETDMIVKIDPESIIMEECEFSTDHPEHDGTNDAVNSSNGAPANPQVETSLVVKIDPESIPMETDEELNTGHLDEIEGSTFHAQTHRHPVPVEPSQSAKQPKKSKANPAPKVHFRCTMCGAEFTEQSTYIRHHQRFHRKPIFSCAKCNQEFPWKYQLKEHHEKTPCGVKPPNYSCPICGKAFVRRDNFQTHLISVHGVGGMRNYKCEQCGVAFKGKDELHKHQVMVHVGASAEASDLPNSGMETENVKIEPNHEDSAPGNDIMNELELEFISPQN